MSEKAEQLWREIPEPIQESLIENVFCRSCLDSVHIVNFTLEMAEAERDIVLQGECEQCGNPVARYIESE